MSGDDAASQLVSNEVEDFSSWKES